jgi:hypothetical protein
MCIENMIERIIVTWHHVCNALQRHGSYKDVSRYFDFSSVCRSVLFQLIGESFANYTFSILKVESPYKNTEEEEDLKLLTLCTELASFVLSFSLLLWTRLKFLTS